MCAYSYIIALCAYSYIIALIVMRVIACLQDQNKIGFFGRPAFFQPFRAF